MKKVEFSSYTFSASAAGGINQYVQLDFLFRTKNKK